LGREAKRGGDDVMRLSILGCYKIASISAKVAFYTKACETSVTQFPTTFQQKVVDDEQ